MIRLGLDPKRCHSYDTSAVAKKRVKTTYIYQCPECKKVYGTKKKQHTRILFNSTRVFCNRCKIELEFVRDFEYI